MWVEMEMAIERLVMDSKLSDDVALARKYTANSPFAEKVACEFTADSGLLHQYYRLRDQQHIGDFARTRAGKDAFDDSSLTIVARKGLLCVGGARITVATAAMPQAMPMEAGELRLSKLFPELDLPEAGYGEISRLVAMADKNGLVTHELLRGLIKLSVAEDIEYLFALTPLPEARKIQQAMQSLDVNCEVRSDIIIPDSDAEDGVKRVLSVMDVSKHAHSLRQKKREKLMLDEPVA